MRAAALAGGHDVHQPEERERHSPRQGVGETSLLHITPTERAVLELLANGRPNHEIAARLRVCEHQLDRHLAGLFARMGATGRPEAIAAAVRRGLVGESQASA